MAFIVRASLNSCYTTWREDINLLNPCSELKIESTFGNRLSCRTPIARKPLVTMASNSVQSVALVPTVEPTTVGTSIMVDFSFCWFRRVVFDFVILVEYFGQECMFVVRTIRN